MMSLEEQHKELFFEANDGNGYIAKVSFVIGYEHTYERDMYGVRHPQSFFVLDGVVVHEIKRYDEESNEYVTEDHTDRRLIDLAYCEIERVYGM